MTAICLAEIHTTIFLLILGKFCLSQILYGIFSFLCFRIIRVFSVLLNCPWIAYLQGYGPQIKMCFSPQKQLKTLSIPSSVKCKLDRILTSEKSNANQEDGTRWFNGSLPSLFLTADPADKICGIAYIPWWLDANASWQTPSPYN